MRARSSENGLKSVKPPIDPARSSGCSFSNDPDCVIFPASSRVSLLRELCPKSTDRILIRFRGRAPPGTSSRGPRLPGSAR